MSKSYDHDEVWLSRRNNKSPYWGPHSTRVYHRLLNMLSEFAPPPGFFFDAGCGAGAFGVQVNAAGYAYCGVDDSREGIELGKEAFPGVELHCVDLCKDQPRSEWIGRFQVAASVNALHCLVDETDRQKFLAYLQSVAAPKGILALTTMCSPFEKDFRPSPRPRAYAEQDDILHEITQAGFREILKTTFEPPSGRAKISNLTVIARKS